MSKKPHHNANHSSDEEDYYDEDYSKTKKKLQAHPRFIKNTIDDVNPEEIVVNLSSILILKQKLIMM